MFPLKLFYASDDEILFRSLNIYILQRYVTSDFLDEEIRTIEQSKRKLTKKKKKRKNVGVCEV